MALDDMHDLDPEQADGLSLDDVDSDVDTSELEAFFAEDYDEGTSDVPADDDVDSVEEPDQGQQRQSGPPSWKSMSDEEIRQVPPDQIRSTIAGLQRLTTQDRQETRDLQRQLVQVQQQQLQTLQALQAMQTQAAPQAQQPQIEDLMDDPQSLMRFVQQTVQETVRQQVDPLRQTVDQSAREAVVAKLEREFAALQKAVPHFRDRAVQGRVIQKMEQANGTLTPREAYTLLYPQQYLEAQKRVVQARTKPTNTPPQKAVTPPGRKTDAKTDVSALVGEETIDQMALMLEKSGSLKSVGPPTGLP